ncbi:hypothetical protein BDC45DRAFT_533383 [Circinella umbellata]|nr:hypothetical protein BDC45DRAFT_533383 [Circinella umbellata]
MKTTHISCMETLRYITMNGWPAFFLQKSGWLDNKVVVLYPTFYICCVLYASPSKILVYIVWSSWPALINNVDSVIIDCCNMRLLYGFFFAALQTRGPVVQNRHPFFKLRDKVPKDD